MGLHKRSAICRHREKRHKGERITSKTSLHKKPKSAIKYLPLSGLTPKARAFLNTLRVGERFEVGGKCYKVVRVGKSVRYRLIKKPKAK